MDDMNKICLEDGDKPHKQDVQSFAYWLSRPSKVRSYVGTPLLPQKLHVTWPYSFPGKQPINVNPMKKPVFDFFGPVDVFLCFIPS